jgi:asparagine synthase (glutamine-hydrolysing)
MCGIAGLWLSEQADATRLGDRVSRMNDALYHRGPDGGDVWLDEQEGIALGQRRLAIIDLSDAGKQPMHSANGRYVMVYNGEIYNAPELREKLASANITWRGHSDTEVILECIAHWGLRDTIKRLIGMFAIALWDRQKKKLFLVRDRLGINRFTGRAMTAISVSRPRSKDCWQATPSRARSIRPALMPICALAMCRPGFRFTPMPRC